MSASTSTARLLKYGLVVIAFALAAPSAAYSAGATKPPPKLKEKPAEPLGQWAYSRLTRAMEHLQEEDYEAAYSELADLRRAGSRLNAHEEAMMWQTYGFAQSSQGDADKAIESFETCLALQGLPGQAQLATRKNLAQLYLMNSNYPKAIENLEIWFAEVEEPGANEYYLLAIAYAHSGKQDVARGYAERAVQLSHAPNEARLQLLSAIYFRDERLMVMAGLFEVWQAPDGSALGSCAMLTTSASASMDGLHARMPVVLDSEDEWDAWLSPGAEPDLLHSLCRPFDSPDFVHHPVDRAVGQVRNQGPGLLHAIDEGAAPSLQEPAAKPAQGSLF